MSFFPVAILVGHCTEWKVQKNYATDELNECLGTHTAPLAPDRYIMESISERYVYYKCTSIHMHLGNRK